MMEKFKYERFAQIDEAERPRVYRELGEVLRVRLLQKNNRHVAIYEAVTVLRALGHDLWSDDESDDIQVWGPNYEYPTGPGLILTFYTSGDGEVDVEWTEQ